MKTMKLLFLIAIAFLETVRPLSGNEPDKSGLRRDSVAETNLWRFSLETNLGLIHSETIDMDYPKGNSCIRKNVVREEYSEMNGFIRLFPKNGFSADDFINLTEMNFYRSSFSEKLGVLAYLSKGLYDLFDYGGTAKLRGPEADDLISRFVTYKASGDKNLRPTGNCRDYAFLTARIAEEGLGLKASVVSGQAHVMTQITGPNETLILIDGGLIFHEINGRALRSKDDVDIAIMRYLRKPEMTDVTIDPEKNAVVYENRYNNFSGFWKRLQNRDNSDRIRGFLAGTGNPGLFSHINDKDVIYGSVERGNLGLQAYWARNRKYRLFLEDVEGLNLAAYVPIRRFPASPGWDHKLFVNLGFYQSLMNMGEENGFNPDPKIVYFKMGRYAYTLDIQVGIEDYLKYSAGRRLRIGMISKLIQYNMEVARDGGGVNRDPEGYASLSPFAGFEIPRNRGRNYFYAGGEITDYLALPNLLKLNVIPWFQIGIDRKKEIIGFDISVRGEFQRASQRFDCVSFVGTDLYGLEVRAFFENYSREFRQDNLFRNTAGAEIRISRHLKRKRQISLGISGESDNGGHKDVSLNAGLRF